MDTSIAGFNLSSVSETLDNLEPIFDERSITGNRIVDMELFATVIHVRMSFLLKKLALCYRKIMKKKDWHHC